MQMTLRRENSGGVCRASDKCGERPDIDYEGREEKKEGKMDGGSYALMRAAFLRVQPL